MIQGKIQDNWRLISVGLLALIAIVAGTVYAAHHGGGEVRVAAIRHDDGRVEVGVQQRGADGNWGAVQRPEHRFLPADSSGQLLFSSSVAIEGAAADSMQMDGMEEAAMPAMPAVSDALYRVVHHGAAKDPFWNWFNTVASQSASDLGLGNVEIHGEPEVGAQAAAIMDCVDRGAVGVASSIPDLAGLRDAMVAVRQSGSFMLTFNSGADAAGLVGATVHYGLDDRAEGEVAGRAFNGAGLSGTVVCVLHEAANVGLEDRCDGLESAYSGSVERAHIPAGSLTDPVVSGRAIGEAIAAHDAAGVLVLNAELTNTAIGAVVFLDSGA